MTSRTVDGQSTTAASPEAAAAIARGARAWLVSLLDRVPSGTDSAVRALCHVLVATWIADTMAGGDKAESGGFTDVAEYVARSLNSPENSERSDSVKPTLKLLVEVLLSSEGLEVEPFREFVTQTVSILRRADPALEANRSLMEKRILLHGVGVIPKPSTASADGLRVLLENFRLSAPTDVVDALTLELEYLTGWGTRPVDDGHIAPAVGDIIAGFAVQRLRNYELVPAARLLRLLEYLAASGTMVRRDDLYRALHVHHRSHGPFGWYGPEAAKLQRLTSHPADDGDLLVDAELYLPATLECLWTLAEVSMNDWRLFARLPVYAPTS